MNTHKNEHVHLCSCSESKVEMQNCNCETIAQQRRFTFHRDKLSSVKYMHQKNDAQLLHYSRDLSISVVAFTASSNDFGRVNGTSRAKDSAFESTAVEEVEPHLETFRF